MLLYDKTLEKFGYTPYDLTSGSKKPVCLKCDYCQEEFEAQYKNRNNSYKKLPKDCCSKCKFKKREEVSLLTHGVKNSAQRPEVRQKISDSGWIKSEEFAQKKKESMLEKYGVEHAIQSPEIQEKMRNTMNERYGCDHSTKIPGLIEKSVKKSNETKIRKGLIKNNKYKNDQ